MVFNPTTAVGTGTIQAVIKAFYTPSGGSATQQITLTTVASTAIGTEIAGTAYTTGSDVFDVDASGEVDIYLYTAIGGTGTTVGAGDVYLILREYPK